MNVELRVCYAVFDQHSEVLCCSQQRMSVGQKQQVKPYLLYTMSAIILQLFLLRQLGVNFKRAPWDHFTGLDSCRIVLTQPRQDTWVDMYLHSITSFTAEVWAHISQKPPPWGRPTISSRITVSLDTVTVIHTRSGWVWKLEQKKKHICVLICVHTYERAFVVTLTNVSVLYSRLDKKRNEKTWPWAL